ncbi:MAG: hypothetical protein ABIQ18_07085 [Umezawaea sp.]
MNEDEARSALHGVMVASSPPPPMDTGIAVEAGQRAHRRRRTTRAGVVASMAVVGIAAGAALLPGALTGGFLEAANGTVQDAPPAASGAPSTKSTETQWPNGQTDRTATNGPRAAKSADLPSGLATALPSGVALAEWLTPSTQSQFVDYTATGGEVWEYQVLAPVGKTDGTGATGTLLAQITTVGNTFPAGACEVTERMWGIKGTCEVVDVGNKQVGLLTSDGTGDEKRFDQLAAYRYDDGTVVFIAQAKTFTSEVQYPALDTEPLTTTQLTTLATDPKFHLS